MILIFSKRVLFNEIFYFGNKEYHENKSSEKGYIYININVY